MSKDAPALHAIERAILKALSNVQQISINMLTDTTGLGKDQVRRGIEWLKFKNLISLDESSTNFVSLGPAGQDAAKSGLPERRLVNAIKEGKKTLAEILASGRLKKDETNAAVAAAKRNKWIEFVDGGKMEVTLSPATSLEESLIVRLEGGSVALSDLTESEKQGFELLAKRPGYLLQKELKDTWVSLSDLGRSLLVTLEDVQTEQTLTSEMITSGGWREVKLAALDVEAPAPVVFAGRSHPLVDIIDEIKEIFVGLGFDEIDGPMAQSGFWNFDALFIPQDHPAREMQDTFYISGHKHDIPASEELKRRVAQVHKKGWNSSWDESEAKRVVLRTHTTPVTLRYLAASRHESARYFSVGRVFRNEKPSYKHLVEFHQVEGVATAKGLSLRDLMGLQKEFYAKMGIKKVKFWPTFFPYTEPSLQSMVYNERLQKWVELFGMGIFRPQVTRPMGIKNPVLAWGGGIERIAMLRFAIDDLRDLYSNRLSWLRSVPRCQL
ncbi:MAG: phenylalanine--tRNA ligase subunit alpha [Nitrososphaera sp.]|nr:phenylalanine--tRNA ligase subunit alpha [Nitrososphaera sp.]